MRTWNSFDSETEFGEELAPGQRVSETMANDYWQRFAKTGKISDYLNYTAYSRRASGEDKKEF